MSRYREQAAAAAAAVAIRGPLRYAWLGRGNRPPRRALRDAMDAAARRAYLLACLREELYWSFYCRGRVVPARWGEAGPPSAHAGLVEAIEQANTGRAGWEPGWTVERLDGEGAIVTSRTHRAWARPAACRGTVTPRAQVSLPLPSVLPALSPGFITLIGDAGDGAGCVRVYWHVTAPGAPVLVRALTSRLNAAALPFRLKLAHHPLRFDRCDAAVLYLRVGDFSALRPALESLAAELAGWLRPLVPAFTLPLAPGVGLAEDDAGESFGVRRCMLLAEGILDAHEQRGAPPSAIAAAFARAGVDIDAPYLEPALDRHVL